MPSLKSKVSTKLIHKEENAGKGEKQLLKACKLPEFLKYWRIKTSTQEEF